MSRTVARLGGPALALASFLLAGIVDAAPSPANGTITEAAPTLSYGGGPLFTSPEATANNACSNDFTSEAFALTVDLPADFETRRPDDSIRIELGAVTEGDLVLTVLDSAGNSLGDSDNGGPGGPEAVSLPAANGTNQYTILVCVFAGSATAYDVDITLTQTITVPGGSGYAPAFVPVSSPAALGNDAGEPSMGFNPVSKKGMFQAGLETLRVTFPEYRTDDPLNPNGLPESCDTMWEDVSFVTTSTVSLDPIGLGDYTFGRYFSSQLSAKSNNMAYTDDDGETWTPSAGNFPGLAGVDHQTVGWSPYADDGISGPLTNYPNAIYYCGQDIAYANCSRSDDGGTTFLPPVQAYNTLTCGGLHGHIKGAPDGTVYLPNKNCGGQQAVAVTEDNGVNWEVRKVPGSTNGETDPSLGIANDGTVYMCYTATDGRPHAAVSRDKGLTWQHDTNLGAPVGVVSAVFAQGIAGDPDRAACGFLGTTTEGNSGSETFSGIWHAYVSVTYDGGETWSTTNVTPDDPVQGAGGICTSGTTCGSNRNLLDFNDMVIDDKGRPMYAFADGCIGACVDNPTAVGQFSSKAAVARVVGGKSLFAANDVAEPAKPQAACLAGARPQPDMAELTWRKPAWDGRSDITGYKIYRGTSAAAQSLIQSVGVKTAYTDLTLDPNEPQYFYKIVAVNAIGDSVDSNLIRVGTDVGGVIESVCTPPGLTILEDAEGDALDEVPSHDLRKLSISQPYFENGDYKIYFHIKVSDLTVVPANTTWPLNFCSPAFPCTDPGKSVDVGQSTYDATNKYYTVEMTTVAPGTPAAPLFRIRKPTADGTTAGSRTVIAALPESSYAANGLITIGVMASDLGLTNAGAGTEQLSKFQIRVSVNGVAINATPDNMPDALSGAGVFTTSVLGFCAVNNPPQPALAATPQTGDTPLEVDFDGGASADIDSGDSIAQFIFDFGDGSEPVIQSTPTISHTYTSAGDYNARLRVRDSRGLISSSAASKVISVGSPGPGPGPGPSGNVSTISDTRLGGAMPAGLLLLGLAAFAARRRR